jgi:ATP-dependent DNA ligase
MQQRATFKQGEGVMVKNPAGIYRPGERTAAWLKIKWQEEAIVYVSGTVAGIGKRASTIGALRVHDAQGNDLGKVGTGFTDDDLAVIARVGSDVRDMPIKVRYDSVTKDGKLRFPRFVGFLDA